MTQGATQHHLIQTIAEFCRDTGLTERKLGVLAVRDHKAVANIRDGKATLRTVGQLEAFMERYRQGCDDAADGNAEPQARAA